MTNHATLKELAIMEDDIPRDGGKIPEYAATMLVHFLDYKKRVARGELQSFVFNCVFAFEGLDQLLLTMEAIMDEQEYPQASVERRTLKSVRKRAPVPASPFLDLSQEKRNSDLGRLDGLLLSCGKAFCLIRVYFRQNASMQGELRIKDKKETVRFRSALELMTLLHEFLHNEFGGGVA